MRVYILCVLCIFISCAHSARILGVLHVPSKSHYVIGHSILQELAKKGHDVTIASPFTSKEKQNFREIYLDGVPEIGEDMRTDMFVISSGNPITMYKKFANFTDQLAKATIKSAGIQKLIENQEKFDIVLLDNFGNEAFFGLQHVFNSHIIVLSAASSGVINHLVGNVAPYSFVPNIITVYSDRMTFIQRFFNTLASVFVGTYQDFLIIPGQKQLYNEWFDNVPRFEDTIKNASLILVNSHVLYESPRPYLPDMIPIGGAHIPSPKLLPEELQELLDKSTQGVIYFSLGSNLNSKDLSQDKVQIILNTFAKLDQLVLWKYEDEALKDRLPKNVRISKWYPQTDILAHPNIVLFISHGGLLSTTETLYRGVPVLGIPVYGDQPGNIAGLEKLGGAHHILLDQITESTFLEVIQEMLNNKSYSSTMKKLSGILADRPQRPLDTAVFWVEHVIKTNGARHLRCASRDLSLVEYLLLDVIIFAGVIVGTFFTGIILLVRVLCCSGTEKSVRGEKRKRKSKRD